MCLYLSLPRTETCSARSEQFNSNQLKSFSGGRRSSDTRLFSMRARCSACRLKRSTVRSAGMRTCGSPSRAPFRSKMRAGTKWIGPRRDAVQRHVPAGPRYGSRRVMACSRSTSKGTWRPCWRRPARPRIGTANVRWLRGHASDCTGSSVGWRRK